MPCGHAGPHRSATGDAEPGQGISVGGGGPGGHGLHRPEVRSGERPRRRRPNRFRRQGRPRRRPVVGHPRVFCRFLRRRVGLRPMAGSLSDGAGAVGHDYRVRQRGGDQRGSPRGPTRREGPEQAERRDDRDGPPPSPGPTNAPKPHEVRTYNTKPGGRPERAVKKLRVRSAVREALQSDQNAISGMAISAGVAAP